MILLAQSLWSQKDEDFNTFSQFFGLVMNDLSHRLTGQKHRMSSDFGCLGTIGLMSNVPYVASDGGDDEEIFKTKAFLRDHLYFLINPKDYNKSKFMTFAS